MDEKTQRVAASRGRKHPDASGLDCNAKGKVLDSVDNIEIMIKLKPRDWELKYNNMTMRLEFECVPEFPLSRIQDIHIQFIEKTLRRAHSTVGTLQKGHIRDACWAVGLEQTYDPIMEYVNSVADEERQPELLDKWLIDLLQIEDTPYTRAVSRLTILGAAKRMLYPGCQFDTMLVLESKIQGFNKSSLCRSLAPYPDWFTDNVSLKLSAKELIEQTENVVIVEIGELKSIREATIEHIQTLIARREDSARLSYGHFSDTRPRKFIFIGTTNDEHYLQNDQNRRFWPIRVKKRLTDKRLATFEVYTKRPLWNEAFRYVQEHRESTKVKLDSYLWPIAAEEQNKRIEMPRPEWQQLVPLLDKCYMLFNADLNRLFFPNNDDVAEWRPFQPEFRFRSMALKRCRYSPSKEKHPIFKKFKACWVRYDKPEGWSWEEQEQLIDDYVSAHTESPSEAENGSF